MIAKNVEAVKEQIAKACEEAGRDAGEVTLVAVGKTKPVALLAEAYACGCRDFGENKVQELTEKYEVLPKDIRWHMIGHLQRNKVKYLIGKVFLIHGVDSVRLAEEISKESAKKGVVTDICVEVNVAAEASKFGTSMEEAFVLVAGMAKLPNLRILGLMTIAPLSEQEEDNRMYFERLRKLSVDIKKKNIDNVTMEVLSMGMSGDFRTAVKEGATMVRVGTGIFGERQ